MNLVITGDNQWRWLGLGWNLVIMVMSLVGIYWLSGMRPGEDKFRARRWLSSRITILKQKIHGWKLTEVSSIEQDGENVKI